MIRLFDTATRRVVELEPRDPGRVSIYACGLTVYDHPHIGHGRMALVYDILRRYLEWTGLEVHHVSNVTDVDDKIIGRAKKEGRTEAEVAAEFEAVWYGALDKMGIKKPHDDPHATAYIAQMVDLIQRLIDGGVAYQTSDGVYLEVDKVPGYGLLAGQPLDSLRVGARVEVGDEKRSPLDFALWKNAKPGEPVWPAPWGDGRPGWHTECVVMSLDLLGEGFDIHSGGQDLTFPHHENERAQAVADGKDFARLWMHNGFVEMGGEKMSKSIGNVTSLTELLNQIDPRAYRLVVLQAHYRAPVEVTPDTIAAAEAALGRLDDFARRTESLMGGRVDDVVMTRFREHMDDDLDTPGATALLFETLRSANSVLDGGDADVASNLAATVREIAGVFGITFETGGTDLDAHTAALLVQRDEARAAKDFARADAIRDELSSAGWTLEDTPQGTKVHR